MSFELLEFPHDVTGLALNLESDNVGAVLFGDWDEDRRGRHRSSAPASCSRSRSARRCSGRIVDPLGNPLDGKGDIDTDRDAAPPSSRRPASSSASR